MKSFQIPITIEVNIDDLGCESDIAAMLRSAVIATVKHRGLHEAIVGLLITDDETIHSINREHLQHDYPTDVISFAYEMSTAHVEGELVASLDTARREGLDAGWPVLHELLLYVIHGTLHICGMDDQSAEERAEMRAAEQAVLESLGIEMPSATGFSTDSIPSTSANHE